MRDDTGQLVLTPSKRLADVCSFFGIFTLGYMKRVKSHNGFLFDMVVVSTEAEV